MPKKYSERAGKPQVKNTVWKPESHTLQTTERKRNFNYCVSSKIVDRV